MEQKIGKQWWETEGLRILVIQSMSGDRKSDVSYVRNASQAAATLAAISGCTVAKATEVTTEAWKWHGCAINSGLGYMVTTDISQ